MTLKVPYHKPSIGREEIDEVVKTLEKHRVDITRLYSTPENAEETRSRVARLETP